MSSDATQTSAAGTTGLAARVEGWAARLVPLDAVLFGLFMLDRVGVGPAPFGVLLAVAIAAVGFFRRPTLRMRGFSSLTAVYAALLLYLALVSQDAGVDWQQRALRFLILFLLVWVLVQGRFDAYSVVFGMAVGLVLNAAAYYLGLTPDSYPPFLTGWLGDKNVAGLWYASMGVLAVALWGSRRAQVLWLALVGALVFLTGSRTSMSGLAAAIVWMVLRNRLGVPMRLALVGGLVAVLGYAEENLARIGVFADRAGTDLFRSRIDEATALKVAGTPWQGRGLTEAWVWLSDIRTQWFHDSYAALYVEGGVVLLTVILVLWVVVAGGLFDGARRTLGGLVAEGAVVVVLVSAWKLGEVFFTSAGFIVLALALRSRYSNRIEPDPLEGVYPPTAFAVDPLPDSEGKP